MRRFLSRVLLAALLVVGAPAAVLAHTPERIRIGADASVADVTIGDLDDVKGRGKTFRGEGLLHIEGLAPIPLLVTRKFNAKKGTAKYVLKSEKGAEVKFKAKIAATGGDPETPTKVNVRIKTADEDTRIRELAAIQFLGLEAPLPGETAPAGLAIDINGEIEDGLIAVVENVTGESVGFYGPTDEDGTPTAVDSAIVTDAEGVVTELLFDALGRPLQILADNGTVFDLLWYSDRHVRVTVTDPTGEISLAIDIDPLTLEEPDADDDVFIPPDVPAKSASFPAKSSQQTLSLAVRRGGQPYDPPSPPAYARGRHVQIRLSSAAGGIYSRVLTARRVRTGVYDATLIVPGQSGVDKALDKVIANIGFLHGASCDTITKVDPGLFGVVCAAVGVGVAFIPGVQVAALAIATACTGALGAYRVYCNIFKNGGAPGNPNDLEGFLLPRIRSVLKLKSGGPTVFLRGYVREWNQFENSLGNTQAGNTVRATIRKDGRLSFKGNARLGIDLNVAPPAGPGDEADGEEEDGDGDGAPLPPTIRLSMSPGRPKIGTNYTARADFSGIPVGGRVRIALRARGGADIQASQATYAQAGNDGTHTLTQSRTLGASNAHNAYAQIFDASGKRIVFRQLNY